jgi:putative sigma-54 modulation protein
MVYFTCDIEGITMDPLSLNIQYKEDRIMKIQISAKNYPMSDKLSSYIEKKLGKLDKYFNEDVTANVVVSKLRETPKFEATISAKQAVFRAEEANDSIYDAVDIATDRLANQMSKLKGKLEARYKENKALKLEFVPEPEEEEFEDELAIVRRKQVELDPMVAEEAVLQMEMLGHDFFVFLDMDTDAVSVVYKRKGGEYGLIETDR